MVCMSGTGPVCLVYLVSLVYLVCLVCLVYSVEQDQLDEINKLDEPDRPEKPDRPNEQTRLADFFGILLEEWTGFAIPLLATANKLVETLDGIAEPRPVARPCPVAIGWMFRLRRKLLGSIGSIFKTRIHLSDTTV